MNWLGENWMIVVMWGSLAYASWQMFRCFRLLHKIRARAEEPLDLCEDCGILLDTYSYTGAALCENCYADEPDDDQVPEELDLLIEEKEAEAEARRLLGYES